MIRCDGASIAVRLGIVRRNTKFASPGIVAKILVKGAILLAGNQDVFDRIGSCGIGYRSHGRTCAKYACIECETGSREYAKLLQRSAAGLTFIEPLLQIHVHLSL